LPPFWKEARSWKAYAAQFRQRLAEPIFQEPYSLPDVFVWPNGYLVKRPKPTQVEPREKARGNEPDTDRPRDETRRIVSTEQYLKNWADTATKSTAFLILSGDPGGGKSSTARIFVRDLLDANRKVLFVPLHRLPDLHERSFKECLDEYCETIPSCPIRLLEGDPGQDPLVLILDGLDELSRHGEVGLKVAEQFADGVKQTVRNRNDGSDHPRVIVLFCGRPISSQTVAGKFVHEGETLHLLPYVVPEDQRKEFQDDHSRTIRYEGDINLLEIDQREVWWGRYRNAISAPSTWPGEFRDPAITDITALPLMNQLAVMLQRDGDLLIDGKFDRPALYDRLLRKVYDREWGIDRGHVMTEAIRPASDDPDSGFRDFRDLMTVLGQAAWHGGGGRAITVERFEQLCATAKLSNVLKNCKARLTGGALDLFTTFYVRHVRVTGSGSASFEFTHKSFGEYLTAARLVDVVEDYANRLGQSVGSGRRSAVWSNSDLLKEWLREIGGATVTSELFLAMLEEIRFRTYVKTEFALECRKVLVKLLNESIESGLPAHGLADLTFREMTAHGARANHALLCALGASVLAGPPTWPEDNSPPRFTANKWDEDDVREWQKKFSAWREMYPDVFISIAWPTKTSAAEFLKQIREHRVWFGGRTDPLPLAYFDFSEHWLYGLDLTRADLSQSYLCGARLQGAFLGSACLNGANLDQVHLNWAYLENAYLDGAYLKDAYLNGASLDGARLNGANLNGANLNGANLNGANLDGASLDGADFRRAILTGATYGKVKLDTPEGRKLLKKRGAILDDE
jgi:hypothetical protein